MKSLTLFYGLCLAVALLVGNCSKHNLATSMPVGFQQDTAFVEVSFEQELSAFEGQLNEDLNSARLLHGVADSLVEAQKRRKKIPVYQIDTTFSTTVPILGGQIIY